MISFEEYCPPWGAGLACWADGLACWRRGSWRGGAALGRPRGRSPSRQGRERERWSASRRASSAPWKSRDRFRLTRCTQSYLSFAAKPQPNRRMIGKTMTAARRRRKLCPPAQRGSLAAAADCSSGRGHRRIWPPIPAIRAATTEQIVIDRHSGLAIHGFDPVAYFIGGRRCRERTNSSMHSPGRSGAFAMRATAPPSSPIRNSTSRGSAAMTRSPSPVGWRCQATPGFGSCPSERLYLFYTAQAQGAFATAAESLAATADRAWPAVQLTLSP